MGYMGAAWATFFCYFSMMVVSYLVGRRYYPVPYRVMQVAVYILLAALLYFIGDALKPANQILWLALNIFLMAVYLGIIFINERKGTDSK
jgi:uncharacterized membrane protein